jgi:hypothetical protein
MIKTLTAISAALAAAAALALAASPAAASTWHHTHSYLRFPAKAADAKSMSRRVIKLNGWYTWRAFSAHWAHESNPAWRSRLVHLRGRYIWLDYLRVHGRTYTHTSVLRNALTGGQISITHDEPGRAGDGSYHWGSTLDNARAGTTHPSIHT